MKTNKFTVLNNPTRGEFGLMKYLDRRIYRETAKERFSKLDRDYIDKKHKEEIFPTEGNHLLGRLLFDHLKKHIVYYRRKKEIMLADIGAAGGALTTIFALKALSRHRLLDKTKIILVDIAKRALHATLVGDFSLTAKFIREYGLEHFGRNGDGIKDRLSQSRYYSSDLLRLPGKLRNIDICLSGFTHHHLNLFDKKLACEEMEKVTRTGGFIGIVDESLDYAHYIEWLAQHRGEVNSRNERVPIAQESFIGLDEHIGLFRSLETVDKVTRDEYYCFCGVKR
jgi:hypothetical protein